MRLQATVATLPFQKKFASDGTYSTILNDRNSHFTIKYLIGDGEADSRPLIGNFYNDYDHRMKKAYLKSFFNSKQNDHLIPDALNVRIALIRSPTLLLSRMVTIVVFS
jgi:hypothetical protein